MDQSNAGNPENGADKSSRSMIPRDAAARSPVIIDVIANEEPLGSKASSKPRFDAGAFTTNATKKLLTPRSAAIAASVVLGVGALAGGVGVSRQADQARQLARENQELHTRVAALEQGRKADEASGARAAIAALKAELEKTRVSVNAQSGQLVARLDRMDHDASARFDKIEKSLMTRDATASIRALPAPLPTPAPAIAPVATAKEPAVRVAPRFVDRAHIPIGGWVLRDVRDGVAYVEGIAGVREVVPGDALPGAGRVQRIERRAGQWVLVTTNGVIDQEIY